MAHITVGVLRGGPSREYEVSLATGAAVLNGLNEDRYKTRDIFIDRNGQWHSHGAPTTPERALRGIDVVFNALHGEYGEDGTVQKLLDAYNVPYTGSGVFASALAFDKAHTYKYSGKIPGVKVPQYVVVRASEAVDTPMLAAQRVFAAFGPQYVIKPVCSGSSYGVVIAKTLNELADVFNTIFDEHEAVVVQQYIQGREGTCGVINHLREETTYTLPPIEIIYPKERPVWDYESKYDAALTEEICPGNFTKAEKEAMQNAARAIHEALGLRHYSRSDFIVAPSGIYFLEVNNLPGLAPACLMPKALEAVGLSYSDFLDHLISLAIRKK